MRSDRGAVLGASLLTMDRLRVITRCRLFSWAAMTTYLVTRHVGAIEWASSQGLAIDQHLEHLDTGIIEPGDAVLGSLPVNLAAEVCRRGGRYLHLALAVPADARGRPLTADQMLEFDAHIEEYRIERVDDDTQ